jgi:hypothetical protein
MKLQAPTSKLQRSFKLQASNIRRLLLQNDRVWIGAWGLVFLWSLELGIWSFANA